MWLLLIASTSLIACGGEATGDSGATQDTGFCSDAPTLTWDNFGAGFTTENCQSCHASEAVNRYEAPEDVVFDTYDDAMSQGDRILARTLADESAMPPQGGVLDDDKLKLEYWLVCYEGL